MFHGKLLDGTAPGQRDVNDLAYLLVAARDLLTVVVLLR
jgi:hypothetical protein